MHSHCEVLTIRPHTAPNTKGKVDRDSSQPSVWKPEGRDYTHMMLVLKDIAGPSQAGSHWDLYTRVTRVQMCMKGPETPSPALKKLTQCEEKQLEGVRTVK